MIQLWGILFCFLCTVNGYQEEQNNNNITANNLTVADEQLLASVPNKICESNQQCHRKFTQWKQKYLQENWGPQENIYRDYIFSMQVRKIQSHNNQPSLTYKKDVNQFTTLTEDQFQHKVLMTNRNKYKQQHDQVYKGMSRLLQNSQGEWHRWFSPSSQQTVVKEQQNSQLINIVQNVVPIKPIFQPVQPIKPIQPDLNDLVSPYIRGLNQQNSSRLMPNFNDIANGGDGITSVDWVWRGKVTPAKNQGKCGSCYAFAAASLTQTLQLHYNPQSSPNHSQQQLIDCSITDNTVSWGNLGCNGGWAYKSLYYVMSRGILTQQDYPVTGQFNQCRAKKGSFRVQEIISGFGCLTLEKAVLGGTMAVGVSAISWRNYKAGIVTTCKSNPQENIFINHEAIVIAFNSQFWRIKNSWGESWGENGTIRLAKGNTCGICKQSYVGTL